MSRIGAPDIPSNRVEFSFFASLRDDNYNVKLTLTLLEYDIDLTKQRHELIRRVLARHSTLTWSKD